MTTSTSAPTSNSHPAVNPSEVGWQFVPQYYTFVNKEPHRLHCFYNKNSTFIHGTEGEDGTPCYGQQEIHKKITSIGFDDCKVFIHSVDAQSSANGGIIIQVIGEMSNKAEPWRKFVQTFFLAEQPNGYFVLNDIFRFLKEESVEDASGEVAEPEPAPVAPPVEKPLTPAPSIPEPVYEPPREPTPPPAPVVPEEVASVEAAPVDEAPTNDVTEPVVTQTNTPPPEQPAAPAVVQSNGIHTPEPEKAEPTTPAPAAAPELPSQPAPAAPAAQPPSAPTQPVAAPAAAAPPAPAPAPAAPRSWASLAANNSRKWGSAVAQESRGTTETLSAPSSGAQTPVTSVPATSVQRPVQGGPRNEHPLYVAAQSITTPHCFIKGVTEPVSEALLRSTLARFGTIKELEIVRSKACAFIEFDRLDSAKRAITASLAHSQGGDGGVFVDGSEGVRTKITIETKKERGDRPPAGRRGGAPPVNGEGSGRGQGHPGFRGARGGGRGRGAPAAK